MAAWLIQGCFQEHCEGFFNHHSIKPLDVQMAGVIEFDRTVIVLWSLNYFNATKMFEPVA